MSIPFFKQFFWF